MLTARKLFQAMFSVAVMIILVICTMEGSEAINNSNVKNRNKDWEQNWIPENYIRENPPPPAANQSKVYFKVFPLSLSDLSTSNKEFIAHFEILIRWQDCRLNLSHWFKGYYLRRETTEKLWIPKLTYRGCAECDLIEYDYNRDQLYPENNFLVLKSRRLIKLHCDFRFHYYPMDVHRCEIKYQIFPYGIPITLVPESNELKMYTDTPIIDLNINKVGMEVCEPPKIKYQDHSCVLMYFILHRPLSPYICSIYIPSAILVLISWSTFWIDANTAAPRNILGLLAILSLYTLTSSIQGSVPRVSYLKAVDIWMFACQFLVAGAILNFAFAYRIAIAEIQKEEERKLEKLEKARIELQEKEENQIEQEQDQENTDKKDIEKRNQFWKMQFRKMNLKIKENKWNVDKIARIIFPLVFFLFNLIYWSVCLNMRNTNF